MRGARVPGAIGYSSVFRLVGAVGLRPAAPCVSLRRPWRLACSAGKRCRVPAAPRPLGFESVRGARIPGAIGYSSVFRLVGAVGLEPTIPKAEDFKSPAYANSATPPQAASVTRIFSAIRKKFLNQSHRLVSM